MTYERLLGMIRAKGANATSKKLERNTYAEVRNSQGGSVVRDDSGKPAVAVRLHRTDILTYFADGRVRVNLGGWNTVTTRARINEWGPENVHVHNDRGEPCLYLGNWSTTAARFAFTGTVTLTRKGTLSVKDRRAAKRLQTERDERRRELARTMAARRREEKRNAKFAAGIDAFVWWFGGWKFTAAKSVAHALHYVHESFKVAREVEAIQPPDAFEAWHFVNVVDGVTVTMNGGIPVRVGQTLHVPAGAKACQYGLHASPTPIQAHQFCRGPILCRVRCWGEMEYENDKSASAYRYVVAMHDVNDLWQAYRTGEIDFNAACYKRFGVEGY